MKANQFEPALRPNEKLLFFYEEIMTIACFSATSVIRYVSLIKMGQLPSKYKKLSGFSVTLIDLKPA